MGNNINPNEEAGRSQCARILAHLKKGLTITPLEALYNFDCFRLQARIHDLREMGHEIETEMVELPNHKRVARYKLIKANEK